MSINYEQEYNKIPICFDFHISFSFYHCNVIQVLTHLSTHYESL